MKALILGFYPGELDPRIEIIKDIGDNSPLDVLADLLLLNVYLDEAMLTPLNEDETITHPPTLYTMGRGE